MKISFDVDGTYSEYQDEFDSLANMLQNSGHEVGFLTNRSPDEDVQEEFELGFVPDFVIYLATEPDATDDVRSMEKAEMMRSEGIDIHFDDKAEWFPDYVTVIKVE
jgi:hypothetical protein